MQHKFWNYSKYPVTWETEKELFRKCVKMALPRNKEHEISGIILFPEFDDVPLDPVPCPGAPPMIIPGERGMNKGGFGIERWCRASISNFLFPVELSCIENVNVQYNNARKTGRENRIYFRYTISNGGVGTEENDGETAAAEPLATPLSASIFSMIFEYRE